MSATLCLSRNALNPDEDFILHGRPASYWERSGFLPNTSLTSTTARLSQQTIYNPDNYREKKYERKHARGMLDLANNLQYMSQKLDTTLTDGVTFNSENRDIAVQTKTKKMDFTKPLPHETLNSDITEDELLKLYEKKVADMDSLSGAPKSPRDSQWYVNPNHLTTSFEAPTLQSVGRSFKSPERSKVHYSDKDTVALENFPVTLGSSYELVAADYPAARSMTLTAPPSIRRSRSRSATRHRRSQSFRVRDNFDEKLDVDRLYLTTSEAPTIGFSTFYTRRYYGSASVHLITPYQIALGTLRLERLRLEEAKLLEVKRLSELERIRGPKIKWYESKGPEFHYESHKNTELIKSESQLQELLDYREDLLRSSYNSSKKFGREWMVE